jgi:nucleoside-diphosphate-sugar epimerase
MKCVLVTGTTGFVGGALMERLAMEKQILAIAGLRDSARYIYSCEQRILGDLSLGRSGLQLFYGVDVIIHCAARAHIMKDEVADPLAEYRKVNVDGTLNLARQAASAGVRRFIFISSIKVNGESTSSGKPFLASDVPAPQDAYGLSKLEAEQGLLALAGETGMQVVIIRPPLVYGPGVKGNFASMIKLVDRRLPLPLGAIHNLRSLVGIDNLVDLIIRCIDHPEAANRVFLAGDGEDVSTTELLRAVGKAMGRPARLIPLPAAVLRCGAALLGRQQMAQRLLGSLQVDISQTCDVLDWKPPFTLEKGLQRCFLPTT